MADPRAASRVMLAFRGSVLAAAAAGTWGLSSGLLWWLAIFLGAVALSWGSRLRIELAKIPSIDHTARLRVLAFVKASVVALLVFAAGLGVILGSVFVSYRLDDGARRADGPNSLWLGHSWVAEPAEDSEIEALAKTLETNRITDAFFHVGPLDRSGRVADARAPYASSLTARLRALAPNVRPQAWLGQVEARGGGPLRLQDAAVRSNVVATARAFLDRGFEGIHYDIEPIYPGNESFIDLLRRTRAVTGARGAVLSVAAEELDPFGRAGGVVRLGARRYHAWTRAYFAEVARTVDQIAVMTYDTALPTDWLFGWFVRWQTSTLAGLLPEEVTLFMGVPTYEEPNLGHRPRAENMRSGVTAVRKGLSRTGKADRRRIGVAVYADWTTSAREWATYARLWLDRRDREAA